ncbi:MAG: serine hydrolase domain-containing protein [Ekhidna sp.]
MHDCRFTFNIIFFLYIASVFGQRTEERISFEDVSCEIDSIVMNAIRNEAFPGCVVYASKGDSVFFSKSYGYHTYDSTRRVAINDIYDLASVTKVMGATLALMKLYENGAFSLDDPIYQYLKGIGRKVGDVTFREALAHQAGLYPWIPYYKESKKRNGDFKNGIIKSHYDENYQYQLSDSLFLHDDFYDEIKRMIKRSEVSLEKGYRYSGLFFYLIPEIVENLSGEDFDSYLKTQFYDSMNLETLGFNPLNRFDETQIAPTEIDTFFRGTNIHGVVHDEGAIMMKGVSGNAGLFGNATDVSKIWQMLLNDGSYEGVEYLKSQTIELFTTAQYPNNENRRGLGFDKPLLQYDSLISSVAKEASFRSYGHTGYTGTLVWADPENDLLFIFLSNRVYPSRTYTNIYKLNVRPTIHQLFYDYLREN